MTEDAYDPVAGAPPDPVLDERAASFHWDGKGLEPGIGLALSGGGFRAMLFHAGALMRLNELGLLSKVKRVSSVSGGSIAAGRLASVWTTMRDPGSPVLQRFRELVVAPLLDFSAQRIDVMDAIIGLLPGTSAAKALARTYGERVIEGNIRLADMPDEPRFVFCATNLQTGVLWRFSKPYAGDYLVGRIDMPDFLVAEAVAASSAFPPVLSPLVLEPPAGAFSDWPDADTRRPLPDLQDYRARVLLTDGGVYDNHGIEPIVKRCMTLFVSDGGAPFTRSAATATDWLGQLRRILDVTDNQVRALRRRDLINRLQSGNERFVAENRPAGWTDPRVRMGAYWGIDTDPDKLAPPDALPCDQGLTDELARVSTRLSDLGRRTSKRLVNWGYAICDRSVRARYRGPDQPLPAIAQWPYPDDALG